ncbi:hypothetical protein [Streptomyces sp. NPDC050145]|uniref:hypothetical protein n=1 Tax=Streptomyces sp. NPDC050145 TaxID=3365602 RepID=UPI0037AC952B
MIDADPDAPAPWLASLFLPGPCRRRRCTASPPGSPPDCAEATAELPLPERRKDMDNTSDSSTSAETRCYWYEHNELLAGGWEPTSQADVSWHLRRTVGSSENSTEVQRADFADSAHDGRPATGLAFADEAFWAPASALGSSTCALSVRSANLVVDVVLTGERHPASTCEQEAVKIAEAAVKGVPEKP